MWLCGGVPVVRRVVCVCGPRTPRRGVWPCCSGSFQWLLRRPRPPPSPHICPPWLPAQSICPTLLCPLLRLLPAAAAPPHPRGPPYGAWPWPTPQLGPCPPTLKRPCPTPNAALAPTRAPSPQPRAAHRRFFGLGFIPKDSFTRTPAAACSSLPQLSASHPTSNSSARSWQPAHVTHK